MTAWKESRQSRWHKRNPWNRHLDGARTRCKGRGKNGHYKKMGIECHLNGADVRFLYIRDCADQFKEPSLDRIDPKKDYTRGNCRFMEFQENRMRALHGDGWKAKAEACPPLFSEEEVSAFNFV